VDVDSFPPTFVPDSLIGRTLGGRYELLARLGTGGVGVVYQGRHVQRDALVAIKVLPQSAAVSSEWRRRFEREARAVSALAHPNIVPLIDFGIDGDVPYLATELLQGKTLAELMKEGPVSPARALDIVRQTLRGLAFAHRQATAHLDLKPANIFLQAQPGNADHVRLLDFGMARFLEGANGTPSYMAPEQIQAGRVDTRADIYAVGVVLFELLAGRLPYVADTPEGLKEAQVSQPVPSLVSLQPDLSIARLVQPVIARALAKKPADRHPQALWMLSALDAIDGGPRGAITIPERAPTPPVQAPAPMPSARRPREPRPQRWRTPIALAALAAAAGTGVVLLQRHRAPPVESARPVAAQPPPPPPQATPTPTPTAPAPPPATAAATQPRTKPASAVAPGQRARDPWQGAVPEALEPLRDRMEHGERLNEGTLGPAYAFARQNPADPRGWLLIAHAYAQLGWLSNSVERYERAYRADSTCRGDPHMLDDLIKAATHRVAGPAAVRAIRDIYGAEALPAVEKALARGAGEGDKNDTLDHLRDSLTE
jgi:serine/threonine-protein kinase